jgi:hypothetical protein
MGAEVPQDILMGGIDLSAGFMLVLGALYLLQGNGFAVALIVLLVLKSIYYFLKHNTWLNPPAMLDILSALLLFSMFFGFYHGTFSIVGFFMIIKGAFSFVTGLMF